MPFPVLLVMGGATALKGATEIIKGVSTQAEAEAVQISTQMSLDEAQRIFRENKDITTKEIKKLGELKLSIYANQFDTFTKAFGLIKEYESIEGKGLLEAKHIAVDLTMPTEKIHDWSALSLKATEVLSEGIAGVSTGALLAWGAYGGVMALGTTSSGTAISTLYGVAASNATLAWLGGGSIAAGGGGVALGRIVLGGIAVGPALMIAGGLFHSNSKKKLHDAYSNQAEIRQIIEDLKTAETALEKIYDTSCQLNELLLRMNVIFTKSNDALLKVVHAGSDWRAYSRQEKEIVYAAVKTAKVIKGILDTPLLTEDGMITQELQLALDGGRDEIIQLENKTIDNPNEIIQCVYCGNSVKKMAKFCNFCGKRMF